jgi:hypothetical protein
VDVQELKEMVHVRDEDIAALDAYVPKKGEEQGKGERATPRKGEP